MKIGIIFEWSVIKIEFVSIIEAVETLVPAGEMLFQIVGAVAQFERSLIENGSGLGSTMPERKTRFSADLRCEY